MRRISKAMEEIGDPKSYEDTNQKIREISARQEGVDLSRLEKVTRVALSTFPEIETTRGAPVEKVSKQEIHNRFRELKELGHDIKPYSHMDLDESWEYLNEIKRDVSAKASRYCPDVLKDIRKNNSTRY